MRSMREGALVQRLGRHRRLKSSIDSPATPVFTAARDVSRDLLRLVRKATLEIRVDGQIDRAAKRGEMLQHVLEGDAIVGLARSTTQSRRWWRRSP